MFVEKAEADVLAANRVLLIKKVNSDGRIYCDLILDLDDCETLCRGKLQTWALNKCGAIDCFIENCSIQNQTVCSGASLWGTLDFLSLIISFSSYFGSSETVITRPLEISSFLLLPFSLPHPVSLCFQSIIHPPLTGISGAITRTPLMSPRVKLVLKSD